MADPKIEQARMHGLAGRMLARYIRLVHRTSRLQTEPTDHVERAKAVHPFIMAAWHGQFLMLPTLRPPGMEVRPMVARHGDAEIVGAALREFGVELIRGGGAGNRKRDRGGAAALRGALTALAEGATVVMTADVPPGPARRAGAGIITIARLSGRPIIPYALASSRYRALRTWSRFTINLPWSRLVVVAGEPVSVPRDADAATLDRLRTEVERELNRVTRRAYELAGADPRRATPQTSADYVLDHRHLGAGLSAYRTLTRLATPLAGRLLAWRTRQGKEDPARRAERFGIADRPRSPGPLVWFHAASVGELIAVLPLLTALRERRPDLTCLVTTVTLTSAELAARRLAAGDIHQYAPLDTPRFVRAFLDHWRPDLAVFTESEIWPNLIIEAAARRVPLALVNARLSFRSQKRWRRSGRMAPALFGRFDLILAQNDKLERAFTELGGRRVEVSGNLKVDAPPPPVDAAALARLRAETSGRPVFLAASTHGGEEEIVAASHVQAASALKGLLTIIAPRHPERGEAIADMLKSRGIKTARRSGGEAPDPGVDVYIADTIGELGTLYALAPLALIGGALIVRGGQNPIEAVRHGSAVLTGPNWYNFPDAYKALLKRGGAAEVRSAEELAAVMTRLLGNEPDLARMRAGATAALDGLSGALRRTVEALLPLLPPASGEDLRRAS